MALPRPEAQLFYTGRKKRACIGITSGVTSLTGIPPLRDFTMAKDRDLAACMERWQQVFDRDEREARARDAADARLRARTAKVSA